MNSSNGVYLFCNNCFTLCCAAISLYKTSRARILFLNRINAVKIIDVNRKCCMNCA